MSKEERSSSGNFAVLGVLLAAGLVLAGWMLGSEIKATRLSDRYVTVRGLVEREVKADLAVWPITFQETGDDLESVTGRAQSDKQAILKFFTAQGFATSDIEVGMVQVTD